jgi:hypothetical protein
MAMNPALSSGSEMVDGMDGSTKVKTTSTLSSTSGDCALSFPELPQPTNPKKPGANASRKIQCLISQIVDA